MDKLVLSKPTKNSVDEFIKNPSHAILLVGSPGIGKRSLSLIMSQKLLKSDNLDNSPYVLDLHPKTKKSITIDEIRQLEHFLSLKVPGEGSRSLSRIVIISNAETMSLEAQNALLKTLEEPPTNSLFILSTPNERLLLPTITSRVQILNVTAPTKEQLRENFNDYSSEQFNTAYLLSSGLPGLMSAILNEEDHSLIIATELARQLLSSNLYNRLLMVDQLAASKELTLNCLEVLKRMAQLSLSKSEGSIGLKWRQVLSAVYEADKAMSSNAQIKLVLSNLMLNL